MPANSWKKGVLYPTTTSRRSQHSLCRAAFVAVCILSLRHSLPTSSKNYGTATLLALGMPSSLLAMHTNLGLDDYSQANFGYCPLTFCFPMFELRISMFEFRLPAFGLRSSNSDVEISMHELCNYVVDCWDFSSFNVRASALDFAFRCLGFDCRVSTLDRRYTLLTGAAPSLFCAGVSV